MFGLRVEGFEGLGMFPGWFSSLEEEGGGGGGCFQALSPGHNDIIPKLLKLSPNIPTCPHNL